MPDFRPRRVFPLRVNPSEDLAHPMDQGARVDQPHGDPDGENVARAKAGDRDAFEALVRGHHRRVLRVLTCVTGTRGDAEDAAQIVFLKAFQHLQSFQGHARFGTWLTRIAINEGLECVRRRRPMDCLTDDEEGTEFRPRHVKAWADDPEQLYQREELRGVVERAVASLPLRYRMAVLLRDLEQLSTAEAAVALELGIPTLKTHLLRRRLMLREALAPHFLPRAGTAEARV